MAPIIEPVENKSWTRYINKPRNDLTDETKTYLWDLYGQITIFFFITNIGAVLDAFFPEIADLGLMFVPAICVGISIHMKELGCKAADRKELETKFIYFFATFLYGIVRNGIINDAYGKTNGLIVALCSTTCALLMFFVVGIVVVIVCYTDPDTLKHMKKCLTNMLFTTNVLAFCAYMTGANHTAAWVEHVNQGLFFFLLVADINNIIKRFQKKKHDINENAFILVTDVTNIFFGTWGTRLGRLIFVMKEKEKVQ